MTSREELEDVSRKIGRLIAGAMPRGVGFALIVFDFGAGGNLAYMSNADRKDMVKAMKEFIEKCEAGKVSSIKKT